MNEVERTIARKILATLYEAWASHTIASLDPVREEGGWEEGLFHTVVDRLEKQRGLVKEYGSSYTYEITPEGILFTEDNDLVPGDIAEKHRTIRRRILGFLADLYDRQGTLAESDHEELAKHAEVDKLEVLLDLLMLREMGYIRDTSSNTFQITDEGIRYYRGTDYEDII
jgi:hypothetical protein